jgi:hypothetical protein
MSTDPLDKHKSIDMRELQPIGHRSFVAFCYRHLSPLDRNGSPALSQNRDLHPAEACQDLPYSGESFVTSRLFPVHRH